ncbi:hypothetical protein NE237_018432 [Protea cynaroides]|uniref:RING-type domain-containing protein n=1 Tax=Protea cynaroides TaxID=273540 RepID=A0A9Q0QP05_9MAGN|nr:hypothetical protein NE237_018432 [Protea cynaroides]
MVSPFPSVEYLMVEEQYVRTAEVAFSMLQQHDTRNKMKRCETFLYGCFLFNVEWFRTHLCITSVRKEELTKLIEKILILSYEVLGFETTSILFPAVKKMKKIKVSSSDEICVICQQKFETEEEVMALSCCHKYHDKCIFEWLYSSGRCPICRFELASPDAA